jgi:ABC-type oligopeptide transport system substrate-binding subunit
MKRIIASVLAALFILTVFTGCAKRDEDDKGAVIPIYISDDPRSYDPVPMIYKAETVLNTGILFEGLTYLDEDGKVQKGVATEWYTKINEERGEYHLYFKLNDETGWDDRRTVQADDFVYAWRRVLSPETNSPAACLLYNIKNAKEFKSGLVTADDLGVYAESRTLLKVEFNGPFDLDLFLETVASPALVPFREDLVSGREDNWATSADNFAANGALTLKNFEPGSEVTFQRNVCYNRDPESDTAEWKVVKPYQFPVDFTADEEERLQAWEDGLLFYISSFSKEAYDEYERKIKTDDLLSSHTYFFNTTKAPFDNKSVRQALSISLDREEIAEIVGKDTKAATGFVPYGVHDAKLSKSFRKAGGKLIDTDAQLDEAKKLLSDAGIKASDYTITITTTRDTADVAVAEYVESVWEELGFKVDVNSQRTMLYQDALYKGDFDVIALDYQALTTDAFSVLAPFAREYSGSVIEIGQDTDTTKPHITGFDNEEYNALIDEIAQTLNMKQRAKLLHKAEEMLIDESPAIALTFNVTNYMKSGKLKNVDSSIFGYKVFTKAKLSGYEDVKAELEALAEAK